MVQPLLFVGDIHLGRSPHRLAAAGLDPSGLEPSEAWRRVVRAAVDRDVQAVILAGDVVDQDKDRFEAWSHLREGVQRLVQGGVRVLGVAGNHDHVALPRLAERIDAFHLLGRGGVWERVELGGVDLVGWSFPARHHREDPLHSPGLAQALGNRRSDAVAIGILHGDLDASDSPYAPVRRADLEEQGLHAWFLGHIHAPGDLGADRPVGYLGSLVGLDRSETGRRGPWLVHPEAGGLHAEQLPLGPVHWAELTVDISGLPAGDDAQDRLHVALESAVARAAQRDRWLQDGDFSAVGCSVRLAGRTPAREAIARFLDEREPGELTFPVDGVQYVVVHLSDATRPAHDLEALAAEHTPLGQLARLLAELDEAGDEALPDPVRAALEAFHADAWFVDEERYPRPDPVTSTRRALVHLIDQLLAQRDAPEAR